MDDFTFVNVVRSEPGFAGVKLIAVTGLSDRGTATRLLAAGFDGHLVKPLDYDVLLATLNRILSARPPGPAARLSVDGGRGARQLR